MIVLTTEDIEFIKECLYQFTSSTNDEQLQLQALAILDKLSNEKEYTVA